MSKTRKQYTKALKFKVAIEMIKGSKSIAELIKEYGVNQSVLQKWKKQLLDSGANIFDGSVKMGDQSQQAEIDSLQRKIGQLTMEVDFLKKVSSKLN